MHTIRRRQRGVLVKSDFHCRRHETKTRGRHFRVQYLHHFWLRFVGVLHFAEGSSVVAILPISRESIEVIHYILEDARPFILPASQMWIAESWTIAVTETRSSSFWYPIFAFLSYYSTMHLYIVVIISFLFAFLKLTSALSHSTQGIEDLVKRRLPNHIDIFKFVLTGNQSVPANSVLNATNDVYKVSSLPEGEILIEGSSPIALATGCVMLNPFRFWFQ